MIESPSSKDWFIESTLLGVKQWLLKNEKDFSDFDKAILSANTSGHESPLRTFLDCALHVLRTSDYFEYAKPFTESIDSQAIRGAFDTHRKLKHIDLPFARSGYETNQYRISINRRVEGGDNAGKDPALEPLSTEKQGHLGGGVESINNDTTPPNYIQWVEPQKLSAGQMLSSPLRSGRSRARAGRILGEYKSFQPQRLPSLNNSTKGKKVGLFSYGKSYKEPWNDSDEESELSSEPRTPKVITPRLMRTRSSTESISSDISDFPLRPFDSVSITGRVTSSSILVPDYCSAGSDPLDNTGSGGDEELAELSAVIIYIVYLTLGHSRRLGMVENPGASSTGFSQNSRGSSSTDRRCGRSNSSGGSSASRSVDAGNGIKRTRKQNRRDDYDENDENGSRRPHGKKKLIGPSEMAKRFACPFAKGMPNRYPGCVFIHRKDLPGVREHLKRNHFDGSLPLEIHRARSWSQIFLVCYPDWTRSGIPIPSHIYDPTQVCVSAPSLRPQAGIDDQPESLSSAGVNIDLQSSADPSAHLPDLDADESLKAFIPPWLGSSSTPNTLDRQDFLDPQAQQPTLVSQSPVQSSTRHPMQILRDIPLAIDEINEFTRSCVDWFGNDNVGQSVTGDTINTYEFPSKPSTNLDTSITSVSATSQKLPFSVPASLAPTTENEFDQFIRIPPDLRPVPNTLSKGNTDRIVGTAGEISQIANHEAEKRYLLRVARNPARPRTSSESPGHKRFSFDNMNEFGSNFEIWVKSQFYDPPFCWKSWEFECPSRKERFTNNAEVMEELEFVWDAYRTNRAALFLVPKQVEW
ncbi:hypothetical protein TWF281_007488 [Arthrobotrys megalospora]